MSAKGVKRLLLCVHSNLDYKLTYRIELQVANHGMTLDFISFSEANDTSTLVGKCVFKMDFLHCECHDL